MDQYFTMLLQDENEIINLVLLVFGGILGLYLFRGLMRLIFRKLMNSDERI